MLRPFCSVTSFHPSVSIEKIYGKICTGYFIPERKFPQDVVDRAKLSVLLSLKIVSLCSLFLWVSDRTGDLLCPGSSLG